MGRYKLPDNAECVDCGDPFRRSAKSKLIRCPRCRTGKQGTQRGGHTGWDKCPRCGEPKSYAAKVCRECWKSKMEVK